MRIGGYSKLICLAVILIPGALIVSLYSGTLQLNHPDKILFPIRGIDVSRFQGEIDWTRLKTENIHFVFIKATEGGDYSDPTFIENWDRSKQAGLDRGAYHFFTFCRSGKEQARNFIKVVPFETLTLPPVIDLEFGGNCSVRPEREVLFKELGDFVLEVENVYQKPPILYVKYETYEAYIKGNFENLPIWIQDRYFNPNLPDGRPWTFWQYSSRGRISGIHNFVDLNVFAGNKADWQTLLTIVNKHK